MVSNEWNEINKIIKSFSFSHNLECIQLITDATNISKVKKKTNRNILRDGFQIITLIFHCELYEIPSRYLLSHGIFLNLGREHMIKLVPISFMQVYSTDCSYKIKG